VLEHLERNLHLRLNLQILLRLPHHSRCRLAVDGVKINSPGKRQILCNLRLRLLMFRNPNLSQRSSVQIFQCFRDSRKLPQRNQFKIQQANSVQEWNRKIHGDRLHQFNRVLPESELQILSILLL
jgi:hypothetical protein